MRATVLSRLSKVALLCAFLAFFVAPHPQADGRPTRGPRDWSHGQIVTADGGQRVDGRDSREWRSQLKHRRMSQSRQWRDGNDPWDGWPFNYNRRNRDAAPDETPAEVDWSIRTGGYGSVVGYPAKYSLDITGSSCGDSIYFTVNQPGSATAVNLIGITNPYAGCPNNPTGARPTIKFGIRLPYGTATSAVLNLDGTVLYVFESRPISNGGLILHAINTNNITTNPGTYNFNTATWTSAHTLAAPTGLPNSEQLFQINFPGVQNDVASPFLDYSANAIYFGDTAARIHRILNADTAGAGEAVNYPVKCGTNGQTSVVFAEGQAISVCRIGRVHRIDTTLAGPPVCVTSTPQGSGHGAEGGVAPPVIDVSNGQIIEVVGEDALGYGYKGIGLMDLMFTENATATSGVVLGRADGNAPVTPALDDLFWSTNAGFVYAVGSPMSGGENTYLIKVPYNGTSLGNPSGYAQLRRSGGTGDSVPTSPVTEFLTASNASNPDFIYVGGGGGSYRFINRIASGFGGTDRSPVSMANSFGVLGGVISGIAMDTRTALTTGTAATANIYFGTVGIPSSVQSTIVQLAQQF